MTETALHLDAGDHVCAVYRSRDEHDDIVERYLADAISSGRRPFVLDRDQAVDAYGDRFITDPQGLVDEFRRTAVQAVVSGHTALAVAVDVTDVVRTPAARTAFAVVEHLADRSIRSTRAITGLCLYDARALGGDAVAELAGLHQRVVPEDTPFHLCAVGERGVRLDGELDLVSHAGLELGLAAVVASSEGDVVVDVSDLQFIDVWSLHEFERRGRVSGRRFVLQGAQPIVVRLIEASRLDHVTAGAAAA